MTQSKRTRAHPNKPEIAAAAGASSQKLTGAGSKRDQLRERLERESGATLTDLQGVFGWQAHTIRAVISGLRKAGHDVQREASGDGTVYRIVTPKVGA